MSAKAPTEHIDGDAWMMSVCLLSCALLLAACGPSDPDDRGTQRLSTLLISLDTTRADALASYGNRKGDTPFLDRLAGESIQYDYAYTVTPLTLPAHASMLTGLYPLRHRVQSNGPDSLAADALTLAEVSAGAGIQTAGFVAAFVLDAKFGLDQGFDHYKGPPRAPGSLAKEVELRADAVVNDALDWLETRDPGRPFFLWVHLFDPHAPFRAPEGFRGTTDNPYLDELAFVDRQLERLFDFLAAEALLAETLVAVVADHGEGLGEHGEASHGWLCFDTTLRVPLLLRYPDGFRAGERSGAVVSVVDIAPTLASAMGLDMGSGIDGKSLFRSEVNEERGVYFETYHGYGAYRWSPLVGWVDAGGKYIHSSAPQFFDVRADSTEEHDLIESAPIQSYRDAIARLAAQPRITEGAAADAELMEGIAALGYVAHSEDAGSRPELLDATDLPAPQDLIHNDQRMREALELASQEGYVEARAIVATILERNPRNMLATNLLGLCLLKEERWTDARRVLQALIDEGIEFPAAHHNLGLALEQLGQYKEAGASFARALKFDPERESSRHALTRVRRLDRRRKKGSR